MTLYFALVGPYTTTPTIYEIEYNYTNRLITYKWEYDPSLGQFTPIKYTGNLDPDKYKINWHTSLDAAVLDLVSIINRKGYQDHTSSFTAFKFHWPELFL